MTELDKQIICSIFKDLQSLSDEEKKAIDEFEKRISVLYGHKIQTRQLILNLEQLKKNDSEELRQAIIKKVEGILALLNNSFESFNSVSKLQYVEDQESTILSYEINANLTNLKKIAQLKDGAVKGRLLTRIKGFLTIENKEQSIKDKFKERILQLRVILESQKSLVLQEISVLRAILEMFEKNQIQSFSIDGWIHSLGNFQADLDRILKAEKETFVEAFYSFENEDRRAQNLARQLIDQDVITINDLKRDISTFTRPDEFGFYKNTLLTSRVFNDKENKGELIKFLYHCEYQSLSLGEKKYFEAKVTDIHADTDRLTGLHNRRYFESVFSMELSKSQRELLKSMKTSPISLIILDIDFFKRFNDSYGHQVGDDVLKFVASVLSDRGFFGVFKRKNDLTCRWGGEEFVILLLGMPKHEAKERAEELRHSIEQKSQDVMSGINNSGLKLNGDMMSKITISLGVATFPEDGQNPVDLMKVADRRLYVAKGKGRNNVVSTD